jgi:hypothetical protein
MVSDWLAEGLDRRSEGTVKLNRNVLKPVVAYLGDIELQAGRRCGFPDAEFPGLGACSP